MIYLRLNQGKKDYKLLKIQMERLFDGIKNVKEDLIIFSDEDEIPNLFKIIKDFDFENFKFGIFLQNMYYYKIFKLLSIDEVKW